MSSTNNNTPSIVNHKSHNNHNNNSSNDTVELEFVNNNNIHNDDYSILFQRHKTLIEAFQLTQSRYKKTLDKYNYYKQILMQQLFYCYNEYIQVYKYTTNNSNTNTRPNLNNITFSASYDTLNNINSNN